MGKTAQAVSAGAVLQTLQQFAQLFGCFQPGIDGAKVAQAATVERQPRQSAHLIGAPFSTARSAWVSRCSAPRKQRHQALRRWRQDRSVVMSGARPEAAPPPVTVRSMAFNNEPSRLPEGSCQLQIGAGGSINERGSASSRSGRAKGGRSEITDYRRLRRKWRKAQRG